MSFVKRFLMGFFGGVDLGETHCLRILIQGTESELIEVQKKLSEMIT